MTLAIDIAVEHEAWAGVGDLDALARRAVAAALEASGVAVVPDAELSVVLCDDAFIQDLNARWRGKDRPTNVLSFPTNVLSFPTEGPPMLGDIVVAYETSAREAADEGRSLADHLAHLLVHGLFHLLGFDHEEDGEAAAMEGLEARALAHLGIVSPYEDMTSL